MTTEELAAKLLEAGAREAGPQFMRKPDRWWDDPHWRCTKDHVQSMFLKSEVKGGICLTCFEPVFLTFPEDRSGPLDLKLLPQPAPS